MQERYDKNGKRFLEVTEEDKKKLPPETRIYCMPNGVDGIVPPDCKHDFIVTGGMPMNIKGCKKCIYWEFTNEPPTETTKQ